MVAGVFFSFFFKFSRMSIGALGSHDVGGSLEFDGEEKMTDRKYAYWEREIHALLVFLVKNKRLSVDELRRAVEALEPVMYKSLTYYERWTGALCSLLVERGVISRNDLETALGPPIESLEPVFKVGDVVRVKPEGATRRWRKPHLRIPG
jgi:nitrile hydratase